MRKLRWWLYKKICFVGWLVCQEPERKAIQHDYDRALEIRRHMDPCP